MPVTKIQFKPGVVKDVTPYTAENGWIDADKVRFRMGMPEKIGGWVKYIPTILLGVIRSLHNWTTLGGGNYLGIGTSNKFYVEYGGAAYDITPIKRTVSLLNPFSTTLGSPIVQVTDIMHGEFSGDFVTFSAASPVAGLNLSREFSIVERISENVYTIDAGAPANATTTGGGSTVASYQINTGSVASISGDGWGSGFWSRGGWGTPASTEGLGALRLWSQDNFGQDLVANPRNGGIYYWMPDNAFPRMVPLSELPNADEPPSTALFILVSEVDRHLLAFGCNDIFQTNPDKLLVRWCSQENPSIWSPAATNTAGSLRLTTGNEIVTARRARQETLIWTDTSLHSLQYVGGQSVFGIQQLADNISVISPNATAHVNNVTYWMGTDKFYSYSGRVETLNCPMRTFIFKNLSRTQQMQVTAGTVEEYSEIWWFYPSMNSMINDLYVVYNYADNIWYNGTLSRTAWLDSSTKQFPIGADMGNLYFHENGLDDGSTSPVSPITAYIESGDFDLVDGDKFAFVKRMLPDLSFQNSTATEPELAMTLSARNSSGLPPNQADTAGGDAIRAITMAVGQYTGQIWVRIRGRQMRLRVSSDMAGVQWQLGSPRIDVQPDGRR